MIIDSIIQLINLGVNILCLVIDIKKKFPEKAE